MSGGIWGYEDGYEDSYTIYKIPIMIDVLMNVFHEIDWAESGDTDRKDAEPLVYDLMLELGNRLFGHGDNDKDIYVWLREKLKNGRVK
jgi:hypothetical protein